MLRTKGSPRLHPDTFALCAGFAHTLAEPALGLSLAISLRNRRRKLPPSLALPLKAADVLEHPLGAEQLLKRRSCYVF